MKQGWSNSCACAALVLVTATVVLLRPGPAASRTGWALRSLTNAEMSGTFGDGSCPCKKEYQCTSSFSDPDRKACSYCTKADTRYMRCCNLGENTKCEYGTTEPCSGSDLMAGNVTGTPGDCLSCSPGTVKKTGSCSQKTATDKSDACP